MNPNYLPLALDDLVHLVSPSPALRSYHDDSDMSPRKKSTSPEPLLESDVVQMRRKVVEMRNVDTSNAQLTPREKELADMVLRLTTVARPDMDQLLRQAEVISALMQQRDLLLHQAEEQRLRWNSEKDGWARMAEALLTQQAKNRLDTERDEDLEHLQAVETDNKDLRQRLNETQSRLQVLESELTRLRPLLLMQPLISCSSMSPPTPNPKMQHARRRRKDPTATEDEEHGASEDEAPTEPLDTPSHTSYSQATPRAKFYRSEAPNNVHPIINTHRRRPSQKATSRGLCADARVEHLLLAARKIGGHRAGLISGMVQHLEALERERRREDSATTAVAMTPKTPKRNMSHLGFPPEGGYTYLNSQTRPLPGMQPVPLFIPAYPHHILQTPSSSTTAPSVTSSTPQSAQKPKQDARTNNPQTPLDSLLSAARSMMREDIDVDVNKDDEAEAVDNPGRTAGTPRTQSRDMLGSPIPKRRKVATRTDKLTALHEFTSRIADDALNASEVVTAGPGRIKSALDVLADQAAAFSVQEPSIALSRAQIQPQMKGKGKVSVDGQAQEPSSSTPRRRGRTKSRRREPEADAAPSTTPTSRSMTPLSGLEDNLTGSTHTTHPRTSGFASEAPVDPGGGGSGSSTSDPSCQMIDSTAVSEGDQFLTNNSAQLSDTFLHVGDSADATPRQGSHVQGMLGEEGFNGSPAVIDQPNSAHLLTSTILENECTVALPPKQHSETTPSSGGNDGSSSSEPMASTVVVKNKGLTRVAERGGSMLPTKRQRSPYVKWSKEEDDLLAQAVAKYGQKWDLVQKALPSRGYHQVRQRWLRKLGKSPFPGYVCVFDSKPDLSSFQTAATTFPSSSRGDGTEPKGNPKLGLAPLSSERALSGLVGRPPSLPS